MILRFGNIDRFVDRVSKIISSVAVIMILWLFLLILINVSQRYIFNAPYKHADEIVRFTMAWIVYFGLGYTLRSGDHIAADILVCRLSPSLQAKFRIAAAGFCALWIALLTYGGYKYWIQLFQTKQRSFGLLELELWIPGVCMVIGLTWFLVEAIIDMAKKILKPSDKEG